ncbi:hypothetical protein [Bradyrhizobium iriomotense]|uniref:hypothetical protein n=1 Tax=Bradyrhizobium iriomotense TaxID=441950 RepID=UPI001B89F020|nr:hypothetical protein [Bradyrhizobium iriomotense]MBR1128994.1 hypothetical protein [Bradyrhizobium iriomotense]
MGELFLVLGGVVLVAVILLARKGRQQREREETERRANAREANRLLKDINKSLGFPEGTGPTGIMVDGEYRVVNIGHAERMKTDSTYAFGNEVAEILLELNDLEGALKEAEAQSDHGLAAKIRVEMTVLEKRAIAMAETQRRS